MDFWLNVIEKLKEDKKLVLLYVLDSIGSSPGRQGFKMVVSEDFEMQGSIGGGIMEHKLVELSVALMKKGSFAPFIKHQIHKSNIAQDKSGMICSGEQTIGFYYLDISNIEDLIYYKKSNTVKLNSTGIYFTDDTINSQFEYSLKNDNWEFKESINYKPQIYIVGGGHVGYSLSNTMKNLGFHITILDNRDNLNTLEANPFADEKLVIDYQEIENYIPEGENIYVVLVSFGFVTDEICMRKLLGKNFKYFGVMGSKTKMKKLIENLQQDDFNQTEIDKVHTPIGVQINSKSTEEIAISIAAEIISVKNQESN